MHGKRFVRIMSLTPRAKMVVVICLIEKGDPSALLCYVVG